MEKAQLFFTGHARVCVQIHPRRQQRSPDPSDTEKTPGNAVKAFLTAIVAHEMRFEWYLRFGPTMTRRGLQSRVSAKTPPKFPLFAVHNTGRDQREEREVRFTANGAAPGWGGSFVDMKTSTPRATGQTRGALSGALLSPQSC